MLCVANDNCGARHAELAESFWAATIAELFARMRGDVEARRPTPHALGFAEGR